MISCKNFANKYPEENHQSTIQSQYYSLYENFKPKFQHGDIVYWHGTNGSKHLVKFGIVDLQIYEDVYVDLLALKECRKIDGVPIEQIKFPSPYYKLPKGWTYKTNLIKITLDVKTIEAYEKIDIKNPTAIKTAYENGLIVEKGKLNSGHIETEIDRQGWRIVMKYTGNISNIASLSINHNRLYHTYEDAEADLDEYNAELQRQANLTDAEWSIEEIDRVLECYKITCSVPDDTIMKYRAILLAKPNIEDVVARVTTSGIQWKYDKNSKWNNVDIDDYTYVKSLGDENI